MVGSARRLRPTGLGDTSDVRVTLGVPPKFLVMPGASPGPTGPANVAPGLRHRHNGPGSPGPLIGPLEGYPELSMQVVANVVCQTRDSKLYKKRSKLEKKRISCLL